MKAQEIRASIAGLDYPTARRELERRLDELYHELFNLRFQWATRQLKNYQRMTQVKRDIARVKTILRELEQGRGV
ncbi:MAG: 50S ribosomal protein L29 [Anaerolineae bacterium]|nr:50S ribosomal protein L29 [Anaerolineae bacterium]